eukprot:869340_1
MTSIHCQTSTFRLNKSITNQHPDSMWKCNICETSFETLQSLRIHVRIHINDPEKPNRGDFNEKEYPQPASARHFPNFASYGPPREQVKAALKLWKQGTDD